MEEKASNKTKKSIHPLKIFLVASGGGIVGTDYARSFDVDPIVGAIVGGIISLIILNIVRKIIEEREDITKKLQWVCGIIGMLIGATAAISNSTDDSSFFFGGLFGGVIGALIGRAISALIIFAACLVLLLSQGPIGMAVRASILNAKPNEPAESIQPKKTSTSTETCSVVCISNTLTGNFKYQYRWADESEWKLITLKPNWHQWHAIPIEQKFYIKFDSSLGDSYKETNYYLETYKNAKQCEGAKKYEIYSTGENFTLKSVN